MTRTQYYNLAKPDGTDAYNIGDFNGNADTIDTHLHTNATRIEEVQAETVRITNNEIDGIFV